MGPLHPHRPLTNNAAVITAAATQMARHQHRGNPCHLGGDHSVKPQDTAIGFFRDRRFAYPSLVTAGHSSTGATFVAPARSITTVPVAV
jgi:hypothetical protein